MQYNGMSQVKCSRLKDCCVVVTWEMRIESQNNWTDNVGSEPMKTVLSDGQLGLTTIYQAIHCMRYKGFVI